MRRFALAVLSLSIAAGAQELIYYKFEAGAGRTVLNFAPPSSRVSREASLSASSSIDPDKSWIAGRIGSFAFTGDNGLHVLTGLDGAFSGDFTVAFFVRTNRAVTSTRIFGSPGQPGWGCAFSNRRFEIFGLSNGAGQIAASDKDVSLLAFQKWTHVAVLYDGRTGFLTCYLDGKVDKRLAMTEAPFVPRGQADWSVLATPGVEFDEFRLTLRAATDAEILAWSSAGSPGLSSFGQACVPKGRVALLETNAASAGPPRLGNQKFAIEVYGVSNSAFLLAIGASRTWLGAVRLPLDLKLLRPDLAGCLWQNSLDLASIAGVLDGAGASTVGLPIPGDVALAARVLYAQALLVHPLVPAPMVSNGLALGLDK